jgi:hypothetical protein
MGSRLNMKQDLRPGLQVEDVDGADFGDQSKR